MPRQETLPISLRLVELESHLRRVYQDYFQECGASHRDFRTAVVSAVSRIESAPDDPERYAHLEVFYLPDGSRWFRHTPGDPCPVLHESRCQILMRSQYNQNRRPPGINSVGYPSNFYWNTISRNRNNEIVGWRLVDGNLYEQLHEERRREERARGATPLSAEGALRAYQWMTARLSDPPSDNTPTPAPEPSPYPYELTGALSTGQTIAYGSSGPPLGTEGTAAAWVAASSVSPTADFILGSSMDGGSAIGPNGSSR